MEIFIASALFLAGTAIVVKGADVFVDAAGWVSDATGISKVVIGATLVSFATTSPEFFVSLIAILKGANDLSVGNAVGSLICNIGVAFALVAIFGAGKVGDRLFGLKGAVMLISAAALWLFCLNGNVSAIEGVVLVLIFACFTFINIRFSKDGEEKKERPKPHGREIAINAAKFLFGAAAVVLGSNLIVDNAQKIALRLGISEAVIGLTVVAIGTSLPEIVTSITAVVKKQNAISLGNVIGANILDATLILATGSFVSKGGLAVSSQTIWTDLPAALLVMLIAVVPAAVAKKTFKWQGILLIGVYAVYLLYTTLCG